MVEVWMTDFGPVRIKPGDYEAAGVRLRKDGMPRRDNLSGWIMRDFLHLWAMDCFLECREIWEDSHG